MQDDQPTADDAQTDDEDPLDALCDIAQQTTMARAADLWAVLWWGISRQQWADETGRQRKTVKKNVRRGEEDLDVDLEVTDDS